jgi:putative phosphoribosyl transferase
MQAGQRLASRLSKYANRDDVIVLAVPHGGVPVAFEVARGLGAPLDVLILRKLWIPSLKGLPFGAIASGGIRVLDRDVVKAAGISRADIERETAAERKEIGRREGAYRRGRPPLNVKGMVVILVDDAIATGYSMRAAIQALRGMRVRRLVVAAPVAAPQTCRQLRSMVHELVSLRRRPLVPRFAQVSEDEAKAFLDRA